MGLLSFFKRSPFDDRAPTLDAADDVQRARTRARQRLIGASVLLAAGIVGFPLLFETQPRPIPADIAIETPQRDATVRPSAAPPQADPRVITESAADAGREVPPAVAEQLSPAASSPTPHAASPPTAPSPLDPQGGVAAAQPAGRAASAEPVVRPALDEAARARALLEGRPLAAAAVPGAASDAARPRFIVQVGAFADAAVAREARSKVEKLGLKTYMQVVDTDAGKRTRVRVGPFDSREDADKASSRIKSAGLPSAILVL